MGGTEGLDGRVEFGWDWVEEEVGERGGGGMR